MFVDHHWHTILNLGQKFERYRKKKSCSSFLFRNSNVFLKQKCSSLTQQIRYDTIDTVWIFFLITKKLFNLFFVIWFGIQFFLFFWNNDWFFFRWKISILINFGNFFLFVSEKEIYYKQLVVVVVALVTVFLYIHYEWPKSLARYCQRRRPLMMIIINIIIIFALLLINI